MQQHTIDTEHELSSATSNPLSGSPWCRSSSLMPTLHVAEHARVTAAECDHTTMCVWLIAARK